MNMNTFYALDNWTQLTAYLNVDVNATSGSLPGLARAKPNCSSESESSRTGQRI